MAPLNFFYLQALNKSLTVNGYANRVAVIRPLTTVFEPCMRCSSFLNLRFWRTCRKQQERPKKISKKGRLCCFLFFLICLGYFWCYFGFFNHGFVYIQDLWLRNQQKHKEDSSKGCFCSFFCFCLLICGLLLFGEIFGSCLMFGFSFGFKFEFCTSFVHLRYHKTLKGCFCCFSVTLFGLMLWDAVVLVLFWCFVLDLLFVQDLCT